MSKEKDLIKRFREKFTFTSEDEKLGQILCFHQDNMPEVMERFLLTELQALKEEVVGKEKHCDLTEESLQKLFETFGYNQHRQHTEEVFQKFGIK